MKSLKILNLSHNQLTNEFFEKDNIWHLSNLEDLNLSHNPFTIIAKKFGLSSLIKLKSLKMFSCDLENILEVFDDLQLLPQFEIIKIVKIGDQYNPLIINHPIFTKLKYT